MLVLQTLALQNKSTPYDVGTNSCFLRWRYSMSIQGVAFQINPYAGGTNSCFLN